MQANETPEQVRFKGEPDAPDYARSLRLIARRQAFSNLLIAVGLLVQIVSIVLFSMVVGRMLGRAALLGDLPRRVERIEQVLNLPDVDAAPRTSDVDYGQAPKTPYGAE